jgi:hypothetical protein
VIDWSRDGSITIAKVKDNMYTDGKEYKLQPDGTHTLFYFKCDDEGKRVYELISSGHKMV